jgi:hypothetical protein
VKDPLLVDGRFLKKVECLEAFGDIILLEFLLYGLAYRR